MNYKGTALTVGNAALYLAFCALAGTGLLLELRLDEESGATRLFGLGRDDWGEVHFVVALTFIGLAILHVALNWSWIKAAFRRRRPAIAVAGVGALLVVALLLWPGGHSTGAGGPAPRRHQEGDD